jgi:methyl-accepting chemotaxis protein
VIRPYFEKISAYFSHWMGIFTIPRIIAELKAFTPVLPVLSKQLEDVSADLSREVGSLCVDFQQMAVHAKESVHIAGAIFTEGTSNSHADVIQTCRTTMTNLLDHMDQRQAIFRNGIEQMERIHGSVRQVFSILEEVDRTSFANRLVALNAKIEAVHIGQLGAGFEAVAEQISQQADRSSELTEQVSGLLSTMTKEMGSAAAELKRLADLETEQARLSRTTVEENWKNLETVSSTMHATLEKAGSNAEKLVGDINKSIVSLQFQDRVTQRIEHVVHSLEAMAQALSTHKIAETEEHLERQREISENLRSSYTMHSERVAHTLAASSQLAPHVGGEAVSGAIDQPGVALEAAPEIEAGEVELF